MTELTFKEQLEIMRDRLVPGGSAPVVKVHLSTYVDEKFIIALLDELEKLPIVSHLNGEVSPLAYLGYMVLKESSYIS